jgi:hypothetical protein
MAIMAYQTVFCKPFTKKSLTLPDWAINATLPCNTVSLVALFLNLYPNHAIFILCSVHTTTQFTADMPPVKTHARTQIPLTRPESDPSTEEELGTKRATWDNDRDGLLIELLLIGLQQGKKSDSGFKITVFNDAAKQFNIRFKVTPKFKGSQLQTRYHTVSVLFYFLIPIVVA